MELPCWDESARPVRAADAAGGAYAEAALAQRAQGEHLRMIHDMYRDGLAQVAETVAEVVAGTRAIAEAREAVDALGLRSAYQRMGSFCGQICRAVETHHRIEDTHLYPALQAADGAGLGSVLARLYAEHDVVHAMLERLEETLRALATDPRRLGDLDAEFSHLRALLLSHFTYEEDQIGVPLGVHRVMV